MVLVEYVVFEYDDSMFFWDRWRVFIGVIFDEF